MADALTPRFKIIPILVTAVLGLAVIPYGGAILAASVDHYFHTASPKGPTLPWLYAQHAFQLLVALVAIAIAKYFVPADYGLHLPRGKTYILPALLWGIFFGVLMTVVDYAPQLIAHTRPHLDKSMMPVGGWLFFEGVYVGPTEEIPFRALLVTYLATTMPVRLRVGRFEMYWAGVIVALIFALAHVANFFTHDWPYAVGQQLYAFALGVLYAYWLEKSKSVVAPIIGHNASDFTEYALTYAWMGVL